MTGYLQRLLDSALPAPEPPALAPVVKSTSPIFEQNQLLGLRGFQAGETDAEMMPPVSDAPGPRDPNAPVPPIAATALPPLEIPRPHPRPVTPLAPSNAEIGRSVAGHPLAPRPAAADPMTPPPHGPFDSLLEPARPDPNIVEPAPRLETAPVVVSEAATDVPPTPVPQEVASAPVNIEGVTSEAILPIAADATSQPATEDSPAAPQIRTRDTPRALEPIERAPDASPPPSVLEPRPRPDFGDVEPEADQPQPETPQAPPRITIGRVTVELMPDQALAANPARAPRTAATASLIGPLGNRRARRRLFALSRL